MCGHQFGKTARVPTAEFRADLSVAEKLFEQVADSERAQLALAHPSRMGGLAECENSAPRNQKL